MVWLRKRQFFFLVAKVALDRIRRKVTSPPFPHIPQGRRRLLILRTNPRVLLRWVKDRFLALTHRATQLQVVPYFDYVVLQKWPDALNGKSISEITSEGIICEAMGGVVPLVFLVWRCGFYFQLTSIVPRPLFLKVKKFLVARM